MNAIAYKTLNLEQVLDKTNLTVSQLVNGITSGAFPTDLAEGFLWLEVEVDQWLANNTDRKTMVELINSRAQAQRKKYPQLAAAPAAAAGYPYIDISNSTADLLVIQTEYRALGINLSDLLQLIQTHTSIDKTRFVNRVLFGQLRNTESKTA